MHGSETISILTLFAPERQPTRLESAERYGWQVENCGLGLEELSFVLVSQSIVLSVCN